MSTNGTEEWATGRKVQKGKGNGGRGLEGGGRYESEKAANRDATKHGEYAEMVRGDGVEVWQVDGKRSRRNVERGRDKTEDRSGQVWAEMGGERESCGPGSVGSEVEGGN